MTHERRIDPTTGQVIPQSGGDINVGNHYTPREIISEALATLGVGAYDAGSYTGYLNQFRMVLDSINNNKLLLPSYRYKTIVPRIEGNKTSFTWGLNDGNKTYDIDMPYPIDIATLFLAQPGLDTDPFDDMEGNPFTNNVLYRLYPQDRDGFTNSRFIRDKGIPSSYYLQRTRNAHVLYLNSSTYGDANAIYGLVKLSMGISNNNEMALDHVLELEEGHFEYIYLGLAIRIAPRISKGIDITGPLRADFEQVKKDIQERMDIPQTKYSETFNLFDADVSNRSGGRRAKALMESGGWF